MMNGIGGSGDFARNADISIFSCPSTQKNGRIPTVVPMVSHTDHTEHSVQVLVTEHGVPPHLTASSLAISDVHYDSVCSR